MPIQTWKCAECGQPFEKFWSASQRIPKYCSRSCSIKQTSAHLKAGEATRFKPGERPHNAGKRKYQRYQCATCGKKCKRYLPPGREPYKFCSQECRYTGENHPNWHGGKHLNMSGYVVLNLDVGIRGYEHRQMVEKVLGRPLKKTEIVHHVNAIKHDNRNDNFIVCSNAYHRTLERLMSTIYQLEYFGDCTHAEAVAEAHAMLQARIL